MFTRMIAKSVAGVAAFGTVLAGIHGAALTQPAAPEIAAVGCTNPYEDSVRTSTDLSLDRTIGIFGTVNRATVKVTSNVSSTPTGTVRLWIIGAEWAATASLADGEASVRLPRRLSARNTYTVLARYVPPACSDFKRSSSRAYYTVLQAPTRVAASRPDVRRHQRGYVHVRIESSATVWGGKAVVRLYKNGDLRRTRVVTIRRSVATAKMGRIHQGGRWQMRVRYRGTNNFQPSSYRANFWVRR
jgi:hypothetical protein